MFGLRIDSNPDLEQLRKELSETKRTLRFKHKAWEDQNVEIQKLKQNNVVIVEVLNQVWVKLQQPSINPNNLRLMVREAIFKVSGVREARKL